MIKSPQSPLLTNQAAPQSNPGQARLELVRRELDGGSALSSPMRYFSLRHQIEDYISQEALALFAARGWHGTLGQADWNEAERRLLEPCATTIGITDGSTVIRVLTAGYAPRNLAAHIEAGVLYVCGLREHEGSDDSVRMFSLKMDLPADLLQSHIEIVADQYAITLRPKANTERFSPADSLTRRPARASHEAPKQFSAAV